MNQIRELAEIIERSHRIVFFGGAGVSTESQIPDFRSADGLYSDKKAYKYPYPAETMLSASFFTRFPKEFFNYYFNEMIYQDAVPNDAHKILAQLEKEGKLTAVITQNIDGLHQKAGSVNVLELHGSTLRNYSMRNHTEYTLEETMERRDQDGIPRTDDGDIIRPDVVLYEEGLDQSVLQQAVWEIGKADCLIVGGTSLAVYPAAGLIQYFRGKYLVLINREETPWDGRATLVIHDSIGKVLRETMDLLEKQ